MRDDANLIATFFRSLEWHEAKENEAFKHKRGLKNAVRDFLRNELRIPKEAPPEVRLELEKTVGRMEFSIRSKWAKDAAETRAARKAARRKARRLIALKKAERAHKKWRAAKAPELFAALPLQLRPPRGQ